MGLFRSVIGPGDRLWDYGVSYGTMVSVVGLWGQLWGRDVSCRVFGVSYGVWRSAVGVFGVSYGAVGPVCGVAYGIRGSQR